MSINIAYSTCTGSVDYKVPAVVGDSGGIIGVNIRAIDGTGHVFIDTVPNVGIMTEDSLNNAIAYVSQKTDSNKCDFLVSFKTQSESIDGPSGGAAMTVALYSLVQGITPRSDTIITGTIDPYGQVGPVGGLYEKGKSAAQDGAKYFITPTENFFEYTLLKNLEKAYTITVLQTDRIEDIFGFVFYNKTFNSSSFKKREAPDIESYTIDASSEAGKKYEAFKAIAQKIVSNENGELTKIANKNDGSEVVGVYESEIVRQKAIIDKGYYFSAANEAFLNYIDLATLSSITPDKKIYIDQKAQIQNCLNAVGTKDKTTANYEWLVGTDLRKVWAEEKLNSSSVDRITTSDEFLIELHEIMYAKAWCNIAQELTITANTENANAPIIDEASWKNIAKRELDKAKKQNNLADDLKSRLDIAQTSFDNGRYGAAAYDSEYVIAMSSNANKTDVENSYKELEAKKFEGFWSNIYKSQAVYLYRQNETNAAFQTIYYAAMLEDLNTEMKIAITTTDSSGSSQTGNTNLCFSSFVALFLISYVAIKRYGPSNQNKRNS